MSIHKKRYTHFTHKVHHMTLQEIKEKIAEYDGLSTITYNHYHESYGQLLDISKRTTRPSLAFYKRAHVYLNHRIQINQLEQYRYILEMAENFLMNKKIDPKIVKSFGEAIHDFAKAEEKTHAIVVNEMDFHRWADNYFQHLSKV